MFPIKYIDNNLVWNKDNEVFAYYELIPYNYSFLSAEQKFIVHDSFRQLIAQSREGKIHALQIATESSIRSMQEQSKRLVTGKLREVAVQKIDEQTEALVSMIGDNQVDYRFFLGFKLMVTEEQLNLKNIKKSVWLTFKEFLHEVNHTLMNDFVSMPNDEINRYMKMEKLPLKGNNHQDREAADGWHRCQHISNHYYFLSFLHNTLIENCNCLFVLLFLYLLLHRHILLNYLLSLLLLFY